MKQLLNPIRNVASSSRRFLANFGSKISGGVKIAAESLFPYFCLQCGAFLSQGYFCSECFANFEIFQSIFCPVCFKRIPIEENGVWEIGNKRLVCSEHKQKTNLWGLGIATPYEDKNFQKVLFAFKYRGIKNLAYDLSKILTTYFYALRVSLNGFVLASLPLHSKRLNQRGFDHILALANELNKNLKLPIHSDTLHKIKNTKPQVEMKNGWERQENIKESFTAQSCEGSNILLLDDVITTGATLEEAAKTLKEAGAQKIFALVLSKG